MEKNYEIHDKEILAVVRCKNLDCDALKLLLV